MSENGDGLAARIRHRLKFVESFHDRRLFVEVLAVLESPDFVPQVPHPDGTGDPLSAPPAGSGGLDASDVVQWMEARGVSLLPWQRSRLAKLGQ